MPVFGVPRLDDVVAAQSGDATLIVNDPGVESTPFLVQAADHVLAAGGHVTALLTDRQPKRFLASLDHADTDRITILDAHSRLHMLQPELGTPVDTTNMFDTVARIEQAGKDNPESVFLLESLNGLERDAGAAALASQGSRLKEAMGRYRHALATFTQWNEEVALRPMLDGFDNRVHLKGVEDRVITNQYFRIEQIAGKAEDTAPVLYRADGGHVRVYIPKVVVTGDADSGKTTFVHAVCDRARSTEQGGKTVAMDKGHVEREGLRVDVFGTPGQERFDPLLAPIMRQAMGVILIVDSTRPDTFERGQEMLRLAWRNGLHAVIAANKQDVDGALSVEEVKGRLDSDVEVVPCQATDAESAQRVFDRLLYKILSPRAAA